MEGRDVVLDIPVFADDFCEKVSVVEKKLWFRL